MNDVTLGGGGKYFCGIRFKGESKQTFLLQRGGVSKSPNLVTSFLDRVPSFYYLLKIIFYKELTM